MTNLIFNTSKIYNQEIFIFISIVCLVFSILIIKFVIFCFKQVFTKEKNYITKYDKNRKK